MKRLLQDLAYVAVVAALMFGALVSCSVEPEVAATQSGSVRRFDRRVIEGTAAYVNEWAESHPDWKIVEIEAGSSGRFYALVEKK